MNTHTDKIAENKSQAVANSLSKAQSGSKSLVQFTDNRPEAIAQRKLQESINSSPRVQELNAYQQMANNNSQVKQFNNYQTTAGNLASQTAQLKENIEQEPVQRIMKQLGVDKEEYRKKTRNTVYLYAEFDGKPMGVFNTEKGNHAEENLIEHIIEMGFENGDLVVYLSTSPCSSVFCTREDGKEGCQERLEKLKSERNITVKVHADHLYQPQNLVSQESEIGSKGFSSYSSARTSAFEMTFSSLPNKLKTPEIMDDFDQPVAQLQKSFQNDQSKQTTC